MPTKQSWQSSIWKSLETLPEASFPFRNIFFIDVVSSPLPSIAINYGFTIESLCHTCLGFLTKCNKELLFGSWMYSIPPFCLGLKLLQVSSLSIFTSTNSVVKLNWEHNLFLVATSCILFWSQDHLMIILTILSPLTHLLTIKGKISRALLLTWTIGTMKSFSHLIL